MLATKVRNEDRTWGTEYETHDWPEPTKRWWDNWRRSAIAQTFQESDWDFLLETARLHAQFWLGDSSVAAEIRLRVSKYGATPEDRLRLRIEVGPEEPVLPKGTVGKTAREKYRGLKIVS